MPAPSRSRAARYFGFVIGGAVPASLAADWLTSTWDQNAGLYVAGPAAAVVEEIAGAWLADLLRIPRAKSFAFVTGTQMAHATAMAAARNHVLAEVGWDVEEKGLTGAPQIRVFAGEKAHSTFPRALRFVGLGTGSIERIPADEQGRMRPDALREALAGHDGPAIVCAKAGEVNTGSCDDFHEIADAAEAAGAWLHVDGAFGLWAAASPRFAHLVDGAERADSWATDGHKWLNVPYDCGIMLCARPEPHRRAMSVYADYLIHADEGGPRDQMDWTPEFSRRARGFTVYAAIRQLGRSGIAELVERCCDLAARFAAGVAEIPGVEVLNEVVLNQVLFRFETDERTLAVLDAVQRERRRVDERLGLGGPSGDPDLGEQLADDGRRHRPYARRVRRRRVLVDERAVRARDEPQPTELVHVLAEDLAGAAVSDVVVQRPARVGDLKLPVLPPGRPE